VVGGPYEVLELAAPVTWATFYKARDTRLNRIVAVKFSAERFSARADGKRRPLPHCSARISVRFTTLVRITR